MQSRPIHPDRKASARLLESHVRTIAEELVPRDYCNVENLERVADYVRADFESAAAGTPGSAGSGAVVTVRDQPFQAGGRAYRNVCMLFGDGPRVVIGAHYDAAGPYPGADDNASGVAGLLELARLFSIHPPPCAVELVAYCLEEPPFFFTRRMGSYVHAAALRSRGVKVAAMISLEMIGYFRDKPRTQHFPLFFLRPFYPDSGNFIAVVGKLFDRKLVKSIRDAMRTASPLPVHSLNAPSLVPGVSLSDHLSYWRCGFPAAMITDTAMYRNPNYHGPTDTADTLDFVRMGYVVDGVRVAVDSLAPRTTS